MNEHVYAYLKDQMRYAGFGDSLNGELREKMLEGRSFSLVYGKKYGADTVAAVLKFKQQQKVTCFFSTIIRFICRPKALSRGNRLFTSKA